MRISDWSSDVCSSDLTREIGTCGPEIRHEDRVADESGIADDEGHVCRGVARNVQRNTFQLANLERLAIVEQLVELRAVAFEVGTGVEQLTKHLLHANDRSEEHTSELQSLMRI